MMAVKCKGIFLGVDLREKPEKIYDPESFIPPEQFDEEIRDRARQAIVRVLCARNAG